MIDSNCKARLRSAILLCALALFFSCLPQAVAAQGKGDLSDEEALMRLRGITASISSLSCDFTQVTDIPLFAAPVTSRGRLLFKKPASLVWEYAEPMKEGFVLNGPNGFRWEEDKSKRTAFRTDRDPVAALIAGQILIWLAFDPQQIRTEYGLAVQSASPLTLVLTPRREAVRSVLLSLRIAFAENGVAESVELTERSGGSTRIFFRNVVLDDPPDDGEFR
jgi:outer membrane lipoprotein carrier protein